MKKVSVIGAGSWGTAIAFVLAENGHDCLLWARRQEQVDEINEHKTNQAYLPNIALPKSLQATTSLEKAATHGEVIVIAVPTKGVRSICQSLQEIMTNEKLFVHVSKGIEPDSHKRISEMIAEEITPNKRRGIVVLSGPSHAEEVVEHHPTTVTAASEDEQVAKEIQDLFMNHYFRVYTNPDVIGVEIGAALKNVIALGAGVSDGLAYGDNAKAALITRGLPKFQG